MWFSDSQQPQLPSGVQCVCVCVCVYGVDLKPTRGAFPCALHYLGDGGLLVHARDDAHDLGEGAAVRVGGCWPRAQPLHQPLPLLQAGARLLEVTQRTG